MLKFDHISKNALEYIGSKTPELIIKDNVKLKHRFKTMWINTIFMNGKYSKIDDDIFKSLLKHGRITGVDQYMIYIEYNGDVYGVWIGNYSYSYGYISKINDEYIPRNDCLRCVSYKSLKKLALLYHIISDVIDKDDANTKNEFLNKYYKKYTD